jgi:hypothetical protein
MTAALTMHYPFQRESRRARWAWRLASFALALIVTSGLGHRVGLIETVPFLALLALCGLFALLALGLAWAALARLWDRDERGIGRAVAATLVALVVLSPFAVGGVWYATHPPLADISTDLADPPSLAFAARIRNGAMNAVEPIDEAHAALQREHYPNVISRRYDHSLITVYETVRQLAGRQGWRVLRWPDPRQAGRSLTIELEARTPVFGFVSDVAIRIRQEADSTRVDMRSASRYGRHDFGDNARRISAFLDRLDEAMEQILPMPPQ